MNIYTVHYKPTSEFHYEVIKNMVEVVDAFINEMDAHSYAVYLNDKENTWLYQ
jgi:hypothetical protein